MSITTGSSEIYFEQPFDKSANQFYIGKPLTLVFSTNEGLLIKKWTVVDGSYSRESIGNFQMTIGCLTNFWIDLVVPANKTINIYWAALYEGSYDVNTLPPYVPKGKHVEMLNCGISLQPRNLLDNSNFRNPVNQRGQSSYNGITYTIDRWRSWDSNNITTLNDGSISVSVHIVQGIPKNHLKNGSTYTIALCALDGTIYVNSGVYAPDAEDFGDWTHTWVEITDSGDMAIYLRNGTYVWVALYEGSYDASTLPAYQPKGYAAELAECQRYYRRFINSAPAMSTAATAIEAEMPLEPPMRVVPTITINSVGPAYTPEGTKSLSGSYSATNTVNKAGYVFYTPSIGIGLPCVITGIDGYLSADL